MSKKKLNIASLMGRVVLVDKVYKRQADYQSQGNSAHKFWSPIVAEGRPGWVVGERHLQEGIAPDTVRPFQTNYIWTTRDHQGLRDEMQYWPRDDSGRWVKKDTEA